MLRTMRTARPLVFIRKPRMNACLLSNPMSLAVTNVDTILPVAAVAKKRIRKAMEVVP